ncbi:MAG: ATP-binding protein [Ancrocorticia sp.]
MILTYLMAAISLVETTGSLEPRQLGLTTAGLSFNLIYITAASWLMRKGIALDEAERVLDLEKMASRTQKAKSAARQRMNSFIHDHILSVLISVATGLANRRILAATARQTLAMLDQRINDQSSSSSAQLFENIRRMTCELSPRIAIDENHPESVTLPPGVGAALFDATHEALTNALRHAATANYPEPSIRLRFSVTDEGASITIHDDGNGFTPRNLDTSRLGIRRSILDRMQTVGGKASVTSSPGQGTQVVLTHPLTHPHKDPQYPGALSPMHIEDVIKLWPARAIIGYFIVTHIYQLLMYWDAYRHPWVAVVAFLPFAIFALLFLLPWREGVLPAPLAYSVPIICGIANIAHISQTISTSWPGRASWSIGFLTVLCWGLALYSRIAAAGLGIVALVAGIALWVINNNLPLVRIAEIATFHVMSIIAWVFVVLLARWASVRIISDERQRMELEAERIESEQAAAVVESMLDSLDKQVRPILELVVSGEPITAETRQQAALLEAELRDEIRGGTRLTSLIKDPVRRARERGTAVVLMDDRGDDDLPEAAMRSLQECANDILGSTTSERVVIRLAPAGRATFATINTAEEGVAIHEDGSVVPN